MTITEAYENMIKENQKLKINEGDLEEIGDYAVAQRLYDTVGLLPNKDPSRKIQIVEEALGLR